MKYELKQQVTIAASGEQGEVIARAELAVPPAPTFGGSET